MVPSAIEHDEILDMMEVDETPIEQEYTEIEFLDPNRARGKFHILNSAVCY